MHIYNNKVYLSKKKLLCNNHGSSKLCSHWASVYSCFLQNCNETGFFCSSINTLTQKHSETERTHSATTDKKDSFCKPSEIFCGPYRISILVELEGGAGCSIKVIEVWTFSHWLHTKKKISKISVQHYYLWDMKTLFETPRYIDLKIIWSQILIDQLYSLRLRSRSEALPTGKLCLISMNTSNCVIPSNGNN